MPWNQSSKLTIYCETALPRKTAPTRLHRRNREEQLAHGPGIVITKTFKRQKNQLTNQPTIQLTMQPTNHAMNQPTMQPINYATNQPCNQPTMQPTNYATNQLCNQPVTKCVTNQPTSNRAINDSMILFFLSRTM